MVEETKEDRLWDLRINRCRWPMGGTWEQAEFFCGEASIPGGPYCQEHRSSVETYALRLTRRAS